MLHFSNVTNPYSFRIPCAVLGSPYHLTTYPDLPFVPFRTLAYCTVVSTIGYRTIIPCSTLLQHAIQRPPHHSKPMPLFCCTLPSDTDYSTTCYDLSTTMPYPRTAVPYHPTLTTPQHALPDYTIPLFCCAVPPDSHHTTRYALPDNSTVPLFCVPYHPTLTTLQHAVAHFAFQHQCRTIQHRTIQSDTTL